MNNTSIKVIFAILFPGVLWIDLVLRFLPREVKVATLKCLAVAIIREYAEKEEKAKGQA